MATVILYSSHYSISGYYRIKLLLLVYGFGALVFLLLPNHSPIFPSLKLVIVRSDADSTDISWGNFIRFLWAPSGALNKVSKGGQRKRKHELLGWTVLVVWLSSPITRVPLRPLICLFSLSTLLCLPGLFREIIRWSSGEQQSEGGWRCRTNCGVS